MSEIRPIIKYMGYDGRIYLLCGRCEEKLYNCKCPPLPDPPTSGADPKGNE